MRSKSPAAAAAGRTGNQQMAPGSQGNDFVRRVMAEIRKKSPNASSNLLEIGGFEKDWNSFNYNQLPSYKQPAADLIVVRIGEHINDSEVISKNLRQSYLRLIDAIAAPNSKIIVTNSSWKNKDQFNAMVQSIATERKLTFVNLSDLADVSSDVAPGLVAARAASFVRDQGNDAAVAGRVLNSVAPLIQGQLTPSKPELDLSHSPARTAGTPTRYLSFSLLNVSDDESYISMMEKFAAAGVNSFLLNVNWDRIHRTKVDNANWAQLDKQVALAERLGCKVMLKVWVARHDDAGGWWPEQTRPISGDGFKRGLLGGFSLSDAKAVEEANAFIREVMEHFKPKQQAGQILWVTVANTNASEIGYTVDGFDPEKKENTVQTFDYSQPSILAFQGWVQAKYSTLANTNKAWGSDYSRFSDIYPPYTKNQPWSAHLGKIGLDWYLFRHWALRNVITTYRKTVREVDPTYRYYQDMGSCYDGMSNVRATLAFKDLCKDTDGLKVNDAPTYPHRFAMDLIRSNLPGKIIGNEVERISPDYRWYWKDQIDQSFEHGADWVNIFGFYENNLDEIGGILREMSAKWLEAPKQIISTSQTITYTLSDVITQGTSQAQTKWQLEYAVSRKPINVILLEDLLGETTIGNLPPVVKTPLASQQASANNRFEYEIPKETFTDPDGQIAGIKAAGLPTGLSLVGWRIEGNAATSGDYTISITATDNLGSQVTTQFRLTVVASTSDNVFSLFTAGNLITRRLLRTIQNGDTLKGDAMKEMVNILVSPRTGTVGSYSFALSGPKSTTREDSEAPFGLFGDDGGMVLLPGKYTLTVKSYANNTLQGDPVSNQTIVFVVEYSTSTPVPTKRLSDVVAKLGVSFTLNIPESTFQDLGLPLNFISITGLPDGLQNSGGYITGTPTKEGVFTVNVKGGNEAGRVAETTFTFTVTAGNLNQPPVANGPIAGQTAEVNKPFGFTVPDNAFSDPDGQVASIALSGLPEGLASSGRVVSGTPTREGAYAVTVTATDNAGATARLTFTLTVTAAAAAAPRPPWSPRPSPTRRPT